MAVKMSSRYYKFARVALDLADASEHDVTHALCALVVSKNQVLSVGYNQPKTHPISAETAQQELHAEMHAILRCGSPQGADVIVARCRPSGKPGLAKPCHICEGILRRFGVRRVYYTMNSESVDDLQLGEMRL